MPVNLSIKNVPDALAERLRARAHRNNRSLQRELMTIVELAVRDDAPAAVRPLSVGSQAALAVAPGQGLPPGRLSIEQIVERARQHFPRGTPSSVELIREERDRRYGAKWARTNREKGSR